MSLPINRTLIIRAPAIIQYEGATTFTKDDIVVTPRFSFSEIGTSINGGNRDKRILDITYEVTFTPSGESPGMGLWWHKVYGVWNGDAAASSFRVGGSIFGATDRPLVIHAQDGQKYTFKSAAPLRPGALRLKAGESIFGQTTFTCIRANNTAWGAANSMVQVQTGQTFPAITFQRADVCTLPWLVNFGSAIVGMQTLDGITMEITPDVAPVVVDTVGTVDYTLRGLSASVKFTPARSVDAIALMQIQGNVNQARGVSALDYMGDTMELYADGDMPAYALSIIIPQIFLSSGPNVFSSEKPINGEMNFEAVWNVGEPLFQLQEL